MIVYHKIAIKTPVKNCLSFLFPSHKRKHWFLSYFCFSFKVYHALQQAIEQSRDSIILIFLNDIQDYKLYHALHLRRGMFRSHCILNWPAQRERVSAFHQQLVTALKSNSKVHWFLNYRFELWGHFIVYFLPLENCQAFMKIWRSLSSCKNM